ncbi:serine hydrolase [Pseudonocardia sp.]|uniref:D-alanyl-D-alanine carboxypeptidase family protein n=1 Tax=Pseudonocardia sp. TaxID=60912 RepID=UPI0031FD165C
MRRLLRVLGAVVLALVAVAPAAWAVPGVCAGHEAPSGPPAREEAGPVVAPVPVPAEPVGGGALGTCGDAVPADAPPPPTVGATGWVVADLDTGAVLAAHDPHGRQRPASTLKILTTLVVRERLDLDSVVVAAPADVQVDGSRAGIVPGGSYTVRQLLAGLLLSSGNDTANALARTLGGVPAALGAMQAKASALGALDTRPGSVSGLDGPGMSTSAYDLAVLFRVALRDPTILELLGTRSVPFPGFGTRPGFTLSNDDPLLLRYPGAIGGKTGFTDAARHTFVGAAQRNGRRLVVSLVRGEQRPVRMEKQAEALLDYGFALPASTAPVGTLVDAAPAPPPARSASAAFGAAPGARVNPPGHPGWWWAGSVVIVLAVGAAGAGVLRRLR